MSLEFQIGEVVDQLKTKFFETSLIPVRLYQNEPNWVRPLDGEIETIFDPKKNKMFRRGTCRRWILKNSDGHVIGRVAAFVDNKTHITYRKLFDKNKEFKRSPIIN